MTARDLALRRAMLPEIRWPSRLFRGISTACEDLVVGCFLDDRAPLAVPELNRERTLKYLECCYKQGMSWKDAEQQIQDCLRQAATTSEFRSLRATCIRSAKKRRVRR